MTCSQYPLNPQYVVQVLADVMPVTLAYKPDQKVSHIVRRRHFPQLAQAAKADRVQMHYDRQVRKLMLLQLLQV